MRIELKRSMFVELLQRSIVSNVRGGLEAVKVLAGGLIQLTTVT